MSEAMNEVKIICDTPIKPGETRVLSTKPGKRSWTPIALGVDKEIAPFFVLKMMKSGELPWTEGSMPIPAEVFTVDPAISGLSVPTVGSGESVSIEVQNVSEREHLFKATIFTRD